MQRKNNKTLHLRKVLGTIIRDTRISKTKLSGNKLANEYDIGNGTLSRIETGNVDVKFITLWKVAESLDTKLSEIVKMIEDTLEDNFTLTDI